MRGPTGVSRRGALAGAAGLAVLSGTTDEIRARTAGESLPVGAIPPYARGFDNQRKADLGDGRFLNPLLAGDHPDPTILKDGDDYYLTFSTFDSYPGLVIWHSRDLPNWQPVVAALSRNVGAVWAPDLCRHNGRYFIYFAAKCVVCIILFRNLF